MLIAIDVGNTQTVMGSTTAPAVDSWRLSTVRERTADEYRLFLAGLLRQDGYRLEEVHGVALSSVVPSAKAAMIQVAEDMIDGPLVVVGPGVKTGMPIHIDNPHEVGADRVVNAVAASHRYGTPVVSVDFGTSTNMDAVDASGAYIGGAIAPGLEVSLNALINATAALRRVDLLPPRAPSAATRWKRSRAASSTATPAWSTASSIASSQNSEERSQWSPPEAWPRRSSPLPLSRDRRRQPHPRRPQDDLRNERRCFSPGGEVPEGGRGRQA